MADSGTPGLEGIVDLHNHLIPGVDDGAVDLDQSRNALTAMQDAGVTSLVATPHLRGSLTLEPQALDARLAEIDEGWAQLTGLAESEFPGMTLGRGVEIMLDTPRPDLSDPRLRLDGGEFALVEFPFMVVPPRSAEVISELRLQGWRPVIAHPERYAGVDPKLEIVEEWRRAGAILQVNVGSLVGRYGESARKLAHSLLERGWISLLASDYHTRERLTIGAAVARLTELGAAEEAHQLLVSNPRRILKGESLLPVQPIKMQQTLWDRLRKVFR